MNSLALLQPADVAVDRPLSPDEKQELVRHEAAIEKGIRTFFAVGCALTAIRERRLYRQTHKTFELYCDQRWGFSKTHANRMIAGASVLEDLTPIGVKPKNLEQTKPLARLNPEQRRAAWGMVAESAGGNEVTAFQLEQAALQIAPKVTPKPTLTPEQLKERRARDQRNFDRREKKRLREQPESLKSSLADWEQNIRAVTSPMGSGANAKKVGQNIDAAIAAALKCGGFGGDVALFRGGQLQAVVLFKDGSPQVIRRDRMEGGDE